MCGLKALLYRRSLVLKRRSFLHWDKPSSYLIRRLHGFNWSVQSSELRRLLSRVPEKWFATIWVTLSALRRETIIKRILLPWLDVRIRMTPWRRFPRASNLLVWVLTNVSRCWIPSNFLFLSWRIRSNLVHLRASTDERSPVQARSAVERILKG